MDVEQLIAELQVVLVDSGNIPVYVTKTENGITFWPEELYVDNFEVMDGKLYLG